MYVYTHTGLLLYVMCIVHTCTHTKECTRTEQCLLLVSECLVHLKPAQQCLDIAWIEGNSSITVLYHQLTVTGL